MSEFNWKDPFAFDEQLSIEEKFLRDAASDYANRSLMSRVVVANRHEVYDLILSKS